MPRSSVPLRCVVVAAALTVAVAGCDSGPTTTSPPGATVVATTPAATPSPCVKPPKPAVDWPQRFPADIPKPLGAVVTKRQQINGGVTLAQLTAPYSLREAVFYILEEYPQRGYVLGRGDAENTEADAPFQRGDVRGLVKVFIDPANECRTKWLVAVANSANANSPYVNYTPGASPSPLPF